MSTNDLRWKKSVLATNRMIYLLAPCSRVLLEKLTDSQLVKNFPTFYGTWRFITAFIHAATWSYPEENDLQNTTTLCHRGSQWWVSNNVSLYKRLTAYYTSDIILYILMQNSNSEFSVQWRPFIIIADNVINRLLLSKSVVPKHSI